MIAMRRPSEAEEAGDEVDADRGPVRGMSQRLAQRF
jgi:hypothetical protein